MPSISQKHRLVIINTARLSSITATCARVVPKFPKTKVMPYKGGQGQRSKEVYRKLKGEICLRHLFTC